MCLLGGEPDHAAELRRGDDRFDDGVEQRTRREQVGRALVDHLHDELARDHPSHRCLVQRRDGAFGEGGRLEQLLARVQAGSTEDQRDRSEDRAHDAHGRARTSRRARSGLTRYTDGHAPILHAAPAASKAGERGRRMWRAGLAGARRRSAQRDVLCRMTMVFMNFSSTANSPMVLLRPRSRFAACAHVRSRRAKLTVRADQRGEGKRCCSSRSPTTTSAARRI